MSRPRLLRVLILLLSALCARTGLAGEPAQAGLSLTGPLPVARITALGRKMFADPSLSASGRQSCASCHVPSKAYGPPDGLAVQPGGPDLKSSGTRAVPSLRYGQNVPAFSERHFDDDGDDSINQGPTGGHTWDGRAQSVHDQARLPLLSPLEMANANPAAVVARLQKAAYADEFRGIFGTAVFSQPDRAFAAALMTLEIFQQSPVDFYPYSSKYDAFMRKQVKLSAQEARGMALFNDPKKGNCASCHFSTLGSGGGFPQFTDFGYVALGLPRNPAIPANANAGYFDMGLCGPQRTDLQDRKQYCGLFRAPTLRNTATRKVFFHNGVLHSLEEVLHFYAERDTQPEKFYPRRKDGTVDKFNDLPEPYRRNINTEPPFGGVAGGKAVLSETDIRDIIAFLGTLTDGYGRAAGVSTATVRSKGGS
jgi:cytochrome c peroxidase